MSNNYKQYLTFGTFFNLLLQSTKPKQSSKKEVDGRSDKLSEPKVLQSFLNIINPNISYPGDNTGRSECTKFKKGEIDHSSWIEIQSKSIHEQFIYDFTNNYNVLLSRVNVFANDFLDLDNSYKITRLVNSILELIKADDLINDDDCFYFFDNKKITRKKDINNHHDFILQTFLLGTIFYIINKPVQTKNTQTTFFNWYRKNGKRYYFSSNIGEKNIHNIKVETFRLNSIDCKNLSFKTEMIDNPYEKYDEYFKNELRERENIKTILYKNFPVQFKEIYISPVVSNKISLGTNKEQQFFSDDKMSTKYFLEMFGRYISITAPAGYGKSMFMRNLFIKEVLNKTSLKNEDYLIPILIEIRTFNRQDGTIEKMLHDKISSHLSISLVEFLSDLKKGGFLLLFDGLDEIKSSEIDAFFIQLNNLTIKYPNNYFVTSSRPSEMMESINKFNVLSLNGLSLEQAIKLINQLPNYDEDTKKNFCNLLNNTSYKRYTKIAENPLLLTLMFLIFIGNKRLSVKSYQFYERAFEVLYEEHERIKGHEARTFKTNLKKSCFSLLLSEFCYHTFNIEPIEFSDIDILKALRKSSFPNISPDDFVDDLQNNLNLIYKENGKYHFIHKSFHEYFCAKYLSNIEEQEFVCLDKWFENLGKSISSHSLNKGLELLLFLLEINKEKTIRNLIQPYLKRLTCGPMQTSFLNFAYNVYKDLKYGGNCITEPQNHFIRIILETNNLNVFINMNDLKLPMIEKYVSSDGFKIPIISLNDNSTESKEIIKLLTSEQSYIYKIYKNLYK